ncbi:hypothetical protein N7507_009697 [Penicillium longicatenatum]|nr:hypothetical protein N7507_009697 [Penicillium longicatenatum]
MTVITFVATHFLSKSTPSRQKSWMQAVRQRVAFASDYLNDSVTIKMLAGTITNLCPVLTLSIYTAIALHTSRRLLTTSETFTTLSIVSLLSSPLSNLIYLGPKEYLLSESNFDDRVTRYLRHSMEAS